MKTKLLNIGHQISQSRSVSHVELSKGLPYRYIEIDKFHRHNFYMIILIIEGGGNHVIDFESFSIQPNRLFLLMPGQIHLFQPDEKTAYFTLQFTTDFFSLVFNKAFPFIHHFVLDVSKNNTEELSHIFNHLLKEQSANEVNETVLANYLYILIEKIKPVLKSVKHQNRKSHPAIIHFKELIETKFNKNLQVKDYAELLNISPNYLNILSKKETGLSASNHIQGRLILEAKRLLIHSNLTISQIAHDLNFSDTSYFIKRFKEATKQTPKQFKIEFNKILYP